MSLIADALKAAQEARAGRAEADGRTAAARRILAPASHRRRSLSPASLPTHVKLAAAGFGLALALAVTVVAVAPRPKSDPELPLDRLAASTATPFSPGGAGTESTGGATPEREGEPSAAGEAEPPPEAESARPEREPSPAGSARLREPAASPADRAEALRTRSAATAAAAEAEALPLAAMPAPSSGSSVPETEPQQPRRPFQLRLDGPARQSSGAFERALAAQRRGDHATAIQLYEQTVVEDPGNAEALNNLGAAYQATGELTSARDAFRRAISAQPTYAAAWSNLGIVLGALGESGQAQAALAEAIRLDPVNHAARVNLALEYQKQGLTGEARRLLEEVVRTASHMPEAHYALGRLLDEIGDRDAGVRHYRIFLSTGAGRFPALEAAVRQRVQQLGGS